MAATNTTGYNPGPGLALGTPAAAVRMYGASSPTSLAPASIGSFGSGNPHENRQPYLGLNYIIALAGIYPSQGNRSRHRELGEMDPFLGQINLFGCNFAPQRWALCQGQLLAISQNTALFSLLGTYYGGNGTTTFALPDLRSRVPIGFGQGPGLSNYAIGEFRRPGNHSDQYVFLPGALAYLVRCGQPWHDERAGRHDRS